VNEVALGIGQASRSVARQTNGESNGESMVGEGESVRERGGRMILCKKGGGVLFGTGYLTSKQTQPPRTLP